MPQKKYKGTYCFPRCLLTFQGGQYPVQIWDGVPLTPTIQTLDHIFPPPKSKTGSLSSSRQRLDRVPPPNHKTEQYTKHFVCSGLYVLRLHRRTFLLKISFMFQIQIHNYSWKGDGAPTPYVVCKKFVLFIIYDCMTLVIYYSTHLLRPLHGSTIIISIKHEQLQKFHTAFHFCFCCRMTECNDIHFSQRLNL